MEFKDRKSTLDTDCKDIYLNMRHLKQMLKEYEVEDKYKRHYLMSEILTLIQRNLLLLDAFFKTYLVINKPNKITKKNLISETDNNIVYEWYNTLTNTYYIGSTGNETTRYYSHVYDEISNDPFHKAMRKYGLECFQYRVLDRFLTRQEAYDYEKETIKKYKNEGKKLYNIQWNR